MAATAVTTTMAGAINYTYVTDSSADWASVPNSTYFYDKVTKLVYFKNSGGTVLEIFSAGGLTYFTEAQSTSAPNATVNVDSLTAVASTTNADIAIVPKGTGALTLAVADSTATGGNKRGANAVDLQTVRSLANEVASGTESVTIGSRNIASNVRSWAIGHANNVASADSFSIGRENGNAGAATYSGAIGMSNSVQQQYTYAFGYANSCSNPASFALGYSNTSSDNPSFTFGNSNTASNANAVAIGRSNIASAADAVCLGYGNNNAGTFSSVALGYQNTITGTGSLAFAVGQQNTVSGQAMAIGFINNASNGIAIGNTNTASGGGYALGETNTSSGKNSIVTGRQGSSFGIKARLVHAAGQISTVGDSQKSTFILQNRTTDTTATTLILNYSDSITPFNTNQVILQNNSAYGFTGTIVGKQSGSTNAAMWKVEGLIVRGANAASTVITTSTVTLVSNAAGWGTPTLTADTTYGGLQVQVVGFAGTNIQWTGVIETTEVIYA